MLKKVVAVLFGGLISLSICFTSFAGWKSDGNGWWFDNGNGTWPASCWLWIDGNQDGQAECYYFQQNGYILTNAKSPDGYMVDGNGAWVVDGVVQRKSTMGSSTNTVKQDSNKGDTSSQSKKNNEDKVALYDLEPVQMNTYYCSKSSSEKTVQGKLLSNVFEIHDKGYVEYYTGGKYTTLTMTIAPEADYEEDRSGIVQITGDDNEVLNESKEVSYKTTPFELTTDISGQEYVRIKVVGDIYFSKILIDNAEFHN